MQHSDRGRLLTPPAMAGEKIFVGTYTGSVLGLSRKDGKKFCEVPIGEPITFQPALAKGWIYASTEGGTIVGVNLKDPSIDGWPMWGGGPGHNR